jgi:transposase
MEEPAMANAQMPDEFYDLVCHHLPPEQPVGRKGGRPRIRDRIVLKVIWFVLASGCRWEDVPREMGCSGRTAHRRLQDWEEHGIWARLHVDLLRLLRRADKLDPDVAIVDSVIVRAFGGGEQTGPSPVDRSKPGIKHTVLVERHGVPLEIHTAGANARDHTQMMPLMRDFPKIGGKPGRPRELPARVYADRGYDSDALRGLLSWLGIEPNIAKRRTEHGSGLGKIRWVVERTISWLKGLRRVRVCYDRLTSIRNAWATLSACVICFRLLHDNYSMAA